MEHAIGDAILEEFVQGYLACALWTSTGEDDEPLDGYYSVNDIDPASVAGATSECKDFLYANLEDLKQYADRRRKYCNRYQSSVWEPAGRDFWLTKCGHGSGFWDRGLGDLGERLTKAANVYGESNVYVGDDARLYIMGYETFKEA